MGSKEIAVALVELAQRYISSKPEELSADDVHVLFETVSAGGFEPKGLVLGLLRGHYLDQDGSRTGETYAINGFPFKVINQDGSDDYTATGWLDGIMGVAVGGKAEEVQKEIERSVPLQPIQLTAEGDMLREYPPRREWTYLVDHARDTRELSSCVGVHDSCNFWMDRVGATKTHDALLCRGCHLRVLFPKGIKTYGDLRKFLAFKFVPVPA